MAVTARIEKKKLIIEIDLCTPHPSGSGKNTVRASTGGNQQTDLMIDGKPLMVGVNAYTKGV